MPTLRVARTPEVTDEMELRDYAAVLWHRRSVVVGIVVVLVGVAVAASLLQTSRYRASTEVLVRQVTSSSLLDPGGSTPAVGAAAQRTLENELRLAESRTVADAATAAIGHEAEVAVSSDADADVLTFSASSTDPATAATVADAYAQVFVDQRRESLVAEYLEAAGTIHVQVERLDAELVELREERAADLAAIPAGAADRDARIAEVEQDHEARIAPLETERARFVQLISNLDLSANLAQGGAARVISSAEVPEEPYAPATERNVALALAAGLVLGVGAAFVVEHFDTSLRSADQLEVAAAAPTLASIPSLPGWKKGAAPRVVTREDPHAPTAEAYRSLRTSVQFLGIDRPIQMVQLTSPKPGDGKTTTASNLAVAVARAGQRVVLVDCDLRKPRVHDYFGLGNERGFTTVLLGEATLDEVATRIDGVPGLVVIPSGPVPPDPSELLSGKRARGLLSSLREQVDLVVVDSPPVLAVSDPLVLSGLCDGVVLVASAGNSDRDEVARAADQLRQVDAPILGTVLNRAPVGRGGTYGYGGYGTYQAESAPTRSRIRRAG